MDYGPKFDGNAINIIYRGGNLESVLTRGDGKFGKDVTERFRKHLPKEIYDNELTGGYPAVTEIRCEAIMLKHIFEEKYSKEYANARNLVAGIIGKDDVDVNRMNDIKLIPLHCIVDGIHQNIDLLWNTFNENIIFGNIMTTRIPLTAEAYLDAVKDMEEKRESIDYPLDGIVFTLPYNVREYLGENDHDPEWAIAIKFIPEEVITNVEGIEWYIGKTGEFTPVIQLKEVQLAGTKVKKASGYNAGYIVDNKIGFGAIVSLAKAGDIIPEIQEVQVHTEAPKLPTHCPHCNSILTFDGIHLVCENENCEGKIARRLSSACAMLDLKGIGGKTIEPFAKNFTHIGEIFTYILMNHNNPDFSLNEYGIKKDSRSQEIFISSITNIKSLTYAQVILMLGYDGIGKKLSEQLAKEYCGLEADYSGLEKALIEKMKDQNIISYIKNMIVTFESYGINIDKPTKLERTDNSIYACLTGSPKEFGFNTKADFLKNYSQIIEVSVTHKNCQYLITDSLSSESSKMKNARKKGITIVTYDHKF
jgi:DNA ligase (NAD+)